MVEENFRGTSRGGIALASGRTCVSPSEKKRFRLFRFMRQAAREAFSLVEVTIAIGVVSFALLSLLGLLPMGLLVLRDAAAQTACSHIVQKVRGDLTHLPLDEVRDYISRERSFDYEGKEVFEENADQTPIFVATFQSDAPRYPGSDQIKNDLNDSSRVVVTIRRVPGGNKTSGPVVFRTAFSLASTR